SRRILLGATVAMTLGIAALAALGRYAFIWKTAVIPILCIAALLSHRLSRFIRDWEVFLALVILFDFLRGLVFAVITHWQLPVYMQYAVACERWLCGGHAIRVLLSAVMLRPAHFRRYTCATITLMYLGAVVYLLVPTVPPWMSADEFGALPPVAHISAHLYNINLPVLQEAFDINPVAAMPSLHAALPTLCVLIAAEVFGWRALPLVGYLVLVYVAIIYLGEHYLVDVLAGALLAAILFTLSRRRPPALPPRARALRV